MKSRNHNRILAIDPGTHHMGIAVLDGRELTYHGVKTLAATGSPHEQLHECRRIVTGMIRDFRPEIVAMEKTFFAKSKTTALLNVFGEEIRILAERNKLKFVGFAPSTVKKHVTGKGHASKSLVAAAMIKRFPALRAYHTSGKKWKAKYHSNRFDAVAVGVTARDQL